MSISLHEVYQDLKSTRKFRWNRQSLLRTMETYGVSCAYSLPKKQCHSCSNMSWMSFVRRAETVLAEAWEPKGFPERCYINPMMPRDEVLSRIGDALDHIASCLVGIEAMMEESEVAEITRANTMHWFLFAMQRDQMIHFEDFFKDETARVLYSLLDKRIGEERYQLLMEDISALNEAMFARSGKSVILFLIPKHSDFLRYQQLCAEGWGEVLFEQLSEHAHQADCIVDDDGIKSAFDACVK